MKRRLAFLTLAMLALPAAAALAQGGQGPGGGGPTQMQQRRLERLLTGITLTAEQRTRVDSVLAAFTARMPQMQMGGGPPDEATMQQMRALGAQRDSTIRELLTPEQRAVFDQNLATMPQGRRP
jgi:Spy/CpxP family protein refolding chaperone